MSRPLHVIVVGAGIGGLTTTLAMLRRGIDVDVYERAATLGEIGAGMQIGANGARVLFDLGLEGELRDVFTLPVDKEIRMWNTGKTWKLFDLKQRSIRKFGAPYFMIHRGDLHRILAHAVQREKRDAIHVSSTVMSCSSSRDRASIELLSGSIVYGDVVVAADGVHSCLRQKSFGGGPPLYAGCIAWRAVLPRERVPRNLLSPVGVNWVGPAGHVVHYFLRSGEVLNFVGIHEQASWLDDKWVTTGTPVQCSHDYEGWHEDVRAIISALEPTIHKWALAVVDRSDRWSIGRCTMLGDACHASLPFLAQGAGMAIEDACVLSRCLERFDQPEIALRTYERTRAARTAEIVRESAQNRARFHNPVLADRERAAAYVDAEWGVEQVANRYDWLYAYDATRVELDV